MYQFWIRSLLDAHRFDSDAVLETWQTVSIGHSPSVPVMCKSATIKAPLVASKDCPGTAAREIEPAPITDVIHAGICWHLLILSSGAFACFESRCASVLPSATEVEVAPGVLMTARNVSDDPGI